MTRLALAMYFLLLKGKKYKLSIFSRQILDHKKGARVTWGLKPFLAQPLKPFFFICGSLIE